MSRAQKWRLIAVFGAIYSIQGVAEPTEGLIAQPVRSLMENANQDPSQIATFMMLLAIPWWIKPLYGLLTDLVPIFGYRRKSYLLITSLIAAGPLLGLYWFRPELGSNSTLLMLLFLPTLAIAFSDVVADGYMVERGQATGMTGQLQSVQWSAIYGATILTGFAGGLLSHHNVQHLGFLICGALALLLFLIALLGVQERQNEESLVRSEGGSHLWEAATSPVVLGVGGFLFLWNFNPFASTILNHHMTHALGYSEQDYGASVSYMAIASASASLLYGFYCKRVSLRVLLHSSIVMGVISSLAYWMLREHALSLVVISLIVGFAYMTGVLVQLDVAARLCPPHLTGTVFALLMSTSNISLSLATGLGGQLYARLREDRGANTAFQTLVGLGALCTALSWIFVPYLLRSAAAAEVKQDQHSEV